METIVSMTAEEIRKNFDVKKAIAMAEAAPEFDGDPNPGGKVVARGFAEFKEYLKQTSVKSKDKEVVVEIPFRESAAKKLRATGRGWQTRVRNYLMEGLAKGKLAAPTNRTV